ncbi:MAG: hypothetical protein HKM94_11345, partial [Halobacteria archaeon]|nr:hypothetical protein [Halobacteria archaeon]
MRFTLFRAAALSLLLSLFAVQANANLTTDLDTLVAELDLISADLNAITIQNGTACTDLGSLNNSIEDYIVSLEAVTAQLAAPLSLTTEDLTSLDALSTIARGMADRSATLSWDLRSIENSYDLVEYRAALSAMLRLSDDIGTMADRILEMADRILVMADNIGIMADRILITQQLQNSNVALTQAAILVTQQNMVALSDSLSSIGYNLSLGLLSDETQLLAITMANTVLTEANMASELTALELNTTAVLNQTVNLYTLAMQNSQGASHYINGDTLTLLGDLSTIHKALAVSLETYANAINTLAPATDNIILSDATAAMLRLAQDIAIMADRILEMSDEIIV